jgi:hypothetical protein
MKTLPIYHRAMSLTITLMLIVGSLFAQNGESFETYRGILKDSKTKQKVVFATVTIPGTHIGTVSNLDGDFTIKVQKSLNATHVQVSHLGYVTKQIPLADLTKNGNEILIEPSSVDLKGVTVRPDNAEKIVRNALGKIPQNYSEKASMQTGFYRETVKQRKEYLSISEGIIDIYKTSYKNKNENDRVRIFKARKSSSVKSADTLMLKLMGGPNISLLLDIARNPELLFWEESLNEHEFSLEDIVSIDGKMNYVISFTQRPFITIPLYNGKLYIETESLAITMADFSINLDDKEKASQLFVKKKPAGVKITPTSTRYLVTFVEQDGKYYFNYARNELTFKCNWRKRLFSSNYTVMSELAITDRDLQTVTKFPVRDAVKTSSVFADMVTTYNDDDFWGEHNFIEPDQSIEAAIKKYGKRLKRQ